MSEAGYDGETCLECEHFCKGKMTCILITNHKWEYEVGFKCNCFILSLRCRQVRAEEEANELREEANRCSRITSSALERIADSLSAREPESEKPRKPRTRKTRDCDDCKGQGETDEGFCPSCGGLGALLITAAGR